MNLNINQIAEQIRAVEDKTPDGKKILQQLKNYKKRTAVIGITGPPGCGKSTLINCLIAEYRKENKKIGVLAIDPSSSKTKGALLGDRIRMQSHTLDKDVFIRSFATRGSLGGLSKAVEPAVKILDNAGYEIVIIETVGAGQNETEIKKIADAVVLVTTADTLDDIQLLKAGIIEIADVLVVNKTDLNNNVSVEHLESILGIPVILTVATQKKGIGQLVETIENIRVNSCFVHGTKC
ncbi:MAG: GTP-binding protein [Elusimicrobiota bacterium]